MDREQEPAQNGDDGHGNQLVLALLALFVGVVVGSLGAIFRLVLQRADSFRDTFIARAHGEAFAGFYSLLLFAPPRPPSLPGSFAGIHPMHRGAEFHMLN